MFICRLVSVANHMPPTVRSPKCAPQPFMDASVNSSTLYSSAWRGQPTNTFFRLLHKLKCFFRISEQSNDWGNFQWVFIYHWNGLTCNLPIGTVFSKDARIPMNDIRIWGVVIKVVLTLLWTLSKSANFFSVGATSALFKSKLCTRGSRNFGLVLTLTFCSL